MNPCTKLIAAAVTALPAFALAAPAVQVYIDGHPVEPGEMAQTSQTVHAGTAAGQVRIWRWERPAGTTTVVLQGTSGGAVPAWAQEQVQRMQAQMQQIQQLQRLQLEQTLTQLRLPQLVVAGPLPTQRPALTAATPGPGCRPAQPVPLTGTRPGTAVQPAREVAPPDVHI